MTFEIKSRNWKLKLKMKPFVYKELVYAHFCSHASGLWLIVANVQFRVILGYICYSNRRAQIELKIRNLKSKLKIKIDKCNW